MKLKRFIGVVIVTMVIAQGIAAEHPFGMGDADYKKLLESTIISQGNNYRLKKVLAKIRKGEKVCIAAIGGSVTEGAGPAKFTDGYAYQFFRAMKATYAPGDGSNLIFDNAGLSGTSSLTGVVRYKKDVIDVLGQTPDLLIVEFAVNDGGEPLFQRSFEALVRDALVANPETAVMAIYAAATYGNTSGPKKAVADKYAIPQINILDIVNDGIKNGTFTKEQFYSDYVHPTYEGHQVMCEALMNVVSIADKAKADTPAAIPEKSYIQPSLSGMIQITGENEDVKISAGGFNQLDNATQTIKKTNSVEFPSNWHHIMHAQPNNEPFKMEINCKNLVFIWKNQAGGSFTKFGNADVFVDGKKVATFDGGKQGGWNNNEPNLIIDEPAAENHIVEVKMAPGSEKLGFTIITMGYTK